MARKHLWTMEKLKEMSQEINKKMSEDPKYNAKLYAQENNLVYGTLYQALKRNSLFNPSRVRKVVTSIPTPVVDTKTEEIASHPSVIKEVINIIEEPATK